MAKSKKSDLQMNAEDLAKKETLKPATWDDFNAARDRDNWDPIPMRDDKNLVTRPYMGEREKGKPGSTPFNHG